MTYRVPMSLREVADNLAPFRPHVESSPRGVPASLLVALRGETTSGTGEAPEPARTPRSGDQPTSEVHDSGRKSWDSGRDPLQQSRLANEMHTYLVQRVGIRRATVLYHRLLNHVEGEIALELGSGTQAECGK